MLFTLIRSISMDEKKKILFYFKLYLRLTIMKFCYAIFKILSSKTKQKDFSKYEIKTKQKIHKIYYQHIFNKIFIEIQIIIRFSKKNILKRLFLELNFE